MSAFYVGQRVRIRAVCDMETARMVGKEGVVNELDCENETGEFGLIGVDSCGEDDWCFFPSQLEPILRPDNEVGDWAELGFHPSEFVRETAPCKP